MSEEKEELDFTFMSREKYIETQISKYSAKAEIVPEFANGLSMELRQPSEMTDEELAFWYKFQTRFEGKKNYIVGKWN